MVNHLDELITKNDNKIKSRYTSYVGLITFTILIIHPTFASGEQKIDTLVGQIASINGDQKSGARWILSGIWKANIANISHDMDQSSSNRSQIQTNSNNSFISMFDMVFTNGSSMHTIGIYNLTSPQVWTFDNSTTSIDGTATVDMTTSSINQVPTNIRILNNSVINIWLEPSKVNYHFGNTPIMGTVNESTLFGNSQER